MNTLRREMKVRGVGTPSEVTGERTLVVAIPREWARLLGLRQGMKVTLELDVERRILTLLPLAGGE